jgi:hypothetical protein
MSEGFKGQLNRYTCEVCGGNVVTIDNDDGCTPFMIGCRATLRCKGMMASACYRNVTGVPSFEWRKPTFTEFRKMSRGMQDHIEQGGLDLFPLSTEQQCAQANPEAKDRG